jgi:DNA polymerase zeta
MMLRLTKPQNFILLSPSKQQVSAQNAPECIPLVMEPMSRFYSSPVVVLDFQSLYPSIIIAYNYWYSKLPILCNVLLSYSTCLGKIRNPDSLNKTLGTSTLSLPKGLLEQLEDKMFSKGI